MHVFAEFQVIQSNITGHSCKRFTH